MIEMPTQLEKNCVYNICGRFIFSIGLLNKKMEPITLNVIFFNYIEKNGCLYYHLFWIIPNKNNIKILDEDNLYTFKLKVWQNILNISSTEWFIHDIYILVCVSDSWYFIAFFSLLYYFFSKRWQCIVEISMDDSWYFLPMIFSPF